MAATDGYREGSTDTWSEPFCTGVLSGTCTSDVDSLQPRHEISYRASLTVTAAGASAARVCINHGQYSEWRYHGKIYGRYSCFQYGVVFDEQRQVILLLL